MAEFTGLRHIREILPKVLEALLGAKEAAKKPENKGSE